MDAEILLQVGRPHATCTSCACPLNDKAQKHPTVFVRAAQVSLASPWPKSPSQPPLASSTSPSDSEPDQTPVQRLDFCHACWELLRDLLLPSTSPTPSGPVMGFWMTKRVPPPPKRTSSRPSRSLLLAWWDQHWAEPAEVALQQAATPPEDDQPPTLPLDSAIRSHLAALILMRYGAFRWTSTTRLTDELTSPEVLLFRRTGRTHPIRVLATLPATTEDMDRLAEELENHLSQFEETYNSSAA